MAVSSGVGPHRAWLVVNGARFLVEEGSAHRTATKKSGTFSAKIPLLTPGAEALFAGLGDNQSSVVVQTRGQTATLVSGEIDDVDIDYIGGVIEVSGRDASAKLHDPKSAEKWVNKRPHEIVQDLAGRVGLGVQIEQQLSLKMQRQMKDDYTKLTDNISYASVIHKICELMQAHWFVKDGTLHIVSGAAQGGGYTINCSIANGKIVSDALSLKIKRNVQAGKPIKVTVKSWHSREEKKFEGKHTEGGNGTAKEYVYHLPNLMQDHVDQHAKAKAKDHKRHEISISAECVGDPSIDIAGGLTLVGTAFAGSYTLDSIEDSFGMEGHTMTLSAKGPMGGGGSGGAKGGSSGSSGSSGSGSGALPASSQAVLDNGGALQA